MCGCRVHKAAYRDIRRVRNRKPAEVAVVVPAYNAQGTLAATIASVRAQSFRDLEIIIVDDGSRDATTAIAEDAARSDPRIRVLSQANAGVAAARNLGWQSTSAPFIAFVDADDLWAADKIERQMAALEQGGPGTGLAYTWYAMIDQHDRIIYKSDPVYHQGDVIDGILSDNFIGNGSAPLVRRSVLTETGGFDPGLRDRDAQGCEDWQFYCRVAGTFRFAVVPDHLVGYRQLPDAMSANLPRMLRSWLLVTDEMMERGPVHVRDIFDPPNDAAWRLAMDNMASGATFSSAPAVRGSVPLVGVLVKQSSAYTTR